MGIKLKDLKFGELNDIKRNNSNPSGDRRRTSASTAIRMATEKAFEVNTLVDVNTFTGFVVGVRLINRPISEYKDTIVILQETDSTEESDTEVKNYLYKVYIPELEPLPAPKSYQDPVIGLYADVSVAKGRIRVHPSLGALVEVTYEDAETLSHPKITQVLAPNGKTSGFSVGESSTGRGRFENGDKTKVGLAGGDIFRQGKADTSYLALGASYIHMNTSFAKQLGMDRFALSGKTIPWIKDQIDPAIAAGKLDFSKYTHAFFFTGPNSLVATQDGAKVFKSLSKLIEKVRTEGERYDKNIKMTVVTIQGFANYGLKHYSDKTTINSMRATKEYNKLIEAAEGATIDYVIKWAQEGTVDYEVDLDVDPLDKKELARFSMPSAATKFSEAREPIWTKDLLHPNKAGHAKVKEMIEAKAGLLP